MVIDVETSLLWRLNGIQELTDFWIFGIFSGFNRCQCVRDWSGILCERSEQRYSGKPDGFAGTPKIKLLSY